MDNWTSSNLCFVANPINIDRLMLIGMPRSRLCNLVEIDETPTLHNEQYHMNDNDICLV